MSISNFSQDSDSVLEKKLFDLNKRSNFFVRTFF